MILCDTLHVEERRPALAEVACALAERMGPPENATLPPRLAELVTALFALEDQPQCR